MRKIKVILADNHAILRDSLKEILNLSTGIDVVADAKNGREAFELVAKFKPDVVLMDVVMPVMNGIESTRRITKAYPGVKVVALSQQDDRKSILASIKAGASGYILKKSSSADLIACIESVYRSGGYIDPMIAGTVLDDYLKQTGDKSKEDNYSLLSDREREVLKLIAEGHSLSKIARMLYISEKTVFAHRTKIMSKLNLNNRVALIKFAICKGLIQIDS